MLHYYICSRPRVTVVTDLFLRGGGGILFGYIGYNYTIFFGDKRQQRWKAFSCLTGGHILYGYIGYNGYLNPKLTFILTLTYRYSHAPNAISLYSYFGFILRLATWKTHMNILSYFCICMWYIYVNIYFKQNWPDRLYNHVDRLI